jgi:hypothetical protein
MKRWAAVLCLFFAGCMGFDEYYLGPYTPEPPAGNSACGRPTAPPAFNQTAPPPVAQTPPPPQTRTSGTLPIIRNAGEPDLATPSQAITSDWTPR